MSSDENLPAPSSEPEPLSTLEERHGRIGTRPLLDDQTQEDVVEVRPASLQTGISSETSWSQSRFLLLNKPRNSAGMNGGEVEVWPGSPKKLIIGTFKAACRRLQLK